MHILGPGDVVADSKSGDFGGKRSVTASSISSSQDITKRRGGASGMPNNPTESAVKDVDDMVDNDEKGEFSRQAELWARDHSEGEAFSHEADSENRPAEDTDAVIDPQGKKTRSRLKPHFGEGDMENRGV